MSAAVKTGPRFGLDWIILTTGILMLSSAVLGTIVTAGGSDYETTGDVIIEEQLPI